MGTQRFRYHLSNALLVSGLETSWCQTRLSSLPVPQYLAVHHLLSAIEMDHSNMDHGGMDHGDMDMGGQCSMNMLFTWSSKDLCIIFRQWRVTGTFSLILSLVAIVLLTAGYECIREISRRYEQQHSAEMAAYSTSGSSASPQPNESSSLLVVGRDSKAAAERKGTIIKGLLYALQVFYSFFIMYASSLRMKDKG